MADPKRKIAKAKSKSHRLRARSVEWSYHYANIAYGLKIPPITWKGETHYNYLILPGLSDLGLKFNIHRAIILQMIKWKEEGFEAKKWKIESDGFTFSKSLWGIKLLINQLFTLSGVSESSKNTIKWNNVVLRKVNYSHATSRVKNEPPKRTDTKLNRNEFLYASLLTFLWTFLLDRGNPYITDKLIDSISGYTSKIRPSRKPKKLGEDSDSSLVETIATADTFRYTHELMRKLLDNLKTLFRRIELIKGDEDVHHIPMRLAVLIHESLVHTFYEMCGSPKLTLLTFPVYLTNTKRRAIIANPTSYNTDFNVEAIKTNYRHYEFSELDGTIYPKNSIYSADWLLGKNTNNGINSINTSQGGFRFGSHPSMSDYDYYSPPPSASSSPPPSASASPPPIQKPISRSTRSHRRPPGNSVSFSEPTLKSAYRSHRSSRR